jgi:phospholipase/lecithinase/hemolysin
VKKNVTGERKMTNKQNTEQQDNSFLADQKSTFVWTTGADVQKVWRKYGWTPPSETRQDFLFPKNRGADQ